jgi:hypothetical protein
LRVKVIQRGDQVFKCFEKVALRGHLIGGDEVIDIGVVSN